MSEAFKYFAFISYSSHDIEWGKRLQKRLEHYRLPATLCSEHNLPRNPIKPVFFAPTDIQPGGLTEELQERLRSSRHLIVICSPHSAKSEWVGKEIEFFHSLGRTKDIYFFIVEGLPHSTDPDKECFNPIVEKLGLPEILGANINEKIYRQPWLNRERAYVQLISKLLGVEFDTIWQRHKRQLINRAVASSLATLTMAAALIGIWAINQPFNVKLYLNETSFHNENLPLMHDAVVTMTLNNEIKTDTIASIDSCAVFTNIPHRFLNKPTRFTIICCDYLDVDTIISLSQTVTLNINRDPMVYGDVKFCFWRPDKEKYIANEDVEIEGYKTKSDKNGCVRIYIPLEQQKTQYMVKTSIKLENNIKTMPSGENDVLIVKQDIK